MYKAKFYLTDDVNDLDEARNWLSEYSDGKVSDLRDIITRRASEGRYTHDFGDAIDSISWDLQTKGSGQINLETNRDLTRGELQQVTQWVYRETQSDLSPAFTRQEFSNYEEMTDDGEEIPVRVSFVTSNGVEGQRFKFEDVSNSYVYQASFDVGPIDTNGMDMDKWIKDQAFMFTDVIRNDIWYGYNRSKIHDFSDIVQNVSLGSNSEETGYLSIETSRPLTMEELSWVSSRASQSIVQLNLISANEKLVFRQISDPIRDDLKLSDADLSFAEQANEQSL